MELEELKREKFLKRLKSNVLTLVERNGCMDALDYQHMGQNFRSPVSKKVKEKSQSEHICHHDRNGGVSESSEIPGGVEFNSWWFSKPC